MRQQIKDIEEVIDLLKTKKKEYVRKYIEEETNYIYFTDHAMVRYLERVENILLLGNTDQEKLHSYPGDLTAIRKEILPAERQKHILWNDIDNYRISDKVYLVIKGLAVVTVIKRK